MEKVALFAIPGCVTFPYMKLPLHVFEPRYREMVKYCVDEGVPMGVCHTQKIVHEAKKNQAISEALNSNQATYKPENIFSIGRCEIIETLSDGRLHILVDMYKRMSLEREVQTLPFSVVECSELEDERLGGEEKAEASLFVEKILKRLMVMGSGQEQIQERLQALELDKMSPEQFSFYVFSLIRLEPELQQHVLEMRSPLTRLSKLLDVLNKNYR